MPDAHLNFAYSTVATAPSPATSGTSLVVASGDGAKFPAVPFNATIWPIGVMPTSANAEIVRVTAISTDTLTITRTQESTSARTVVVGDQIAATVTRKTLVDIERLVNNSTADQSPSAATRTYLTGSNLAFAAGRLQVGTILRWRLSVTKTAAGTASSTYDLAFGTAGTTSDTARVSFTKPAGTGVADEGVIDIECIIRTASASGVAAGSFRMSHNLNTTGHMTITCAAVQTTSATFDTTTVTNVGLCVTSGASDALTFKVVSAEALNLS